MRPIFLDLWTRFQAEQKEVARLEKFRALSTDELKALWDGFDADAEPGMPGSFWPENAPHIEDVHRLLNERGEGTYCAV